MVRAMLIARLAILLILLAFAHPSSASDATDSFQTRLAEARSLYRLTTSGLRAGKVEDADASLHRLIELWTGITTTFRTSPPGPFRRVMMFADTLDGTGARLALAAESLSQGQNDQALETLLPLKRDWVMLRRTAGLYGLVECLDEATDALEVMMAYKKTPPDLTRAEVRGDVLSRAAVYRWALKRCEAFASADTLGDADYRRLAESIAAALDVVTTAVRLRDPSLLDRVLGDINSFDTLLGQRFG